MKERLYLLFLYVIFWLLFFLSARIIFLSYHLVETKVLTLELVYGIFKHGLRQDISLTAYLSFLPFLLISLEAFIKKSVLEATLFSYTLFSVFILAFIIIVDLEVFNVWRFRLDATPLNYLKTPYEAWISVKSSPILQLIISYIILLAVASYFVYRVLANRFDNWKHVGRWRFTTVGLLLTALLVIPMRGSIGKHRLTSPDLFFSNNYFANAATLNAPWHFFKSAVMSSDNKINPYAFLPRIEVDKQLKKLFNPLATATESAELLTTTSPNVVIVICESLSARNIGLTVEGQEVTPFLNKLSAESIYFPNVYAAGDHTEEGLLAVLNGYPSLPTKSIVLDEGKLGKLNYMSKLFNKSSYSTEFYYGGRTDFMNLKSYLMLSDYNQLFDAPSFPASSQTTAWGVSDEVLFDKFLSNHQQSTNPFFATLLTASSHEPFDVGGNQRFNTTRGDNDYLNAISYLDSSLEKFLNKAKKSPWWSNTVIIILADHSHRFPLTSKNRVEEFKIPMFWTGGAIKSARKIEDVISQTDLAAMLRTQLHWKTQLSKFVKNPLASNQKKWAYFSFNNGFGFADNDGHLLFDNTGKTLLENSYPENLVNERILAGKALQQSSFSDYLAK